MQFNAFSFHKYSQINVDRRFELILIIKSTIIFRNSSGLYLRILFDGMTNGPIIASM